MWCKISDIKSKYITTADFNKFTKDVVGNKIKGEGLVNKCDITGFINNADLDKYVAKLATKSELKAEQEKILKLQALDSSYFRGKSHFEDDGTQNYLVLQPMYRYFKKIGNTECTLSRKSKGLSDENIKPPTTTDNSLAPRLSYIGNKTRVKFDWGCLKADKITYNYGKTINIYFVYNINLWNYEDSSDPTVGKSLFGAVKLEKNLDIYKYKYFEHGTGFDMKGTSSFPTDK